MRWEIASKFQYESTPRVKMAVGEPVIDPGDLPRLRTAFERGGQQALSEALPERYVTSLSATGTVEDVRARVAEYRRAGVDLPLVRPSAPHQLPRLLAASR